MNTVTGSFGIKTITILIYRWDAKAGCRHNQVIFWFLKLVFDSSLGFYLQTTCTTSIVFYSSIRTFLQKILPSGHLPYLRVPGFNGLWKPLRIAADGTRSQFGPAYPFRLDRNGDCSHHDGHGNQEPVLSSDRG
jgi:hypothetical protein